jgi:hypothetical protein
MNVTFCCESVNEKVADVDVVGFDGFEVIVGGGIVPPLAASANPAPPSTPSRTTTSVALFAVLVLKKRVTGS